MEILSKEQQKKVVGGRAPLASECSMTCGSGGNINISSCSDMCTCSENLQRCQCLADDVVKWCA